MRKPVFNPSIRRALAMVCLFAASSCASHGIMMVHPQSGATQECGGSGFGLGAAWVQGYIDDCMHRSESRGFVPVDKLSPEQRLDLERRGLLPKTGSAKPVSN